MQYQRNHCSGTAPGPQHPQNYYNGAVPGYAPTQQIIGCEGKITRITFNTGAVTYIFTTNDTNNQLHGFDLDALPRVAYSKSDIFKISCL